VAVAEFRQRRIESGAGGSDDNGYALSDSKKPDGVLPFTDGQALDATDGIKPKGVAQHAYDEKRSEGHRIAALRAPGLQVGPVRLRDAPVPSDLIANVETFGNSVIGIALRRRLELSDAGKPFRGEESAFNGKGVELDLRFPDGSTASSGHQFTIT
jgi:hypothetical protein